MKHIIVLVVLLFILIGCQNESDTQTSQPDEQHENSADSLDAISVEDKKGDVEISLTKEPSLQDTAEEIVNPEKTAANADVLFVSAKTAGDNSWVFAVTVEHPDSGWEDYADGWDVVLPDGTVIKPDPDSPFTRLLLHPHETEQPFTRSQSGVNIPLGIEWVIVRAHDLVDGFGGREVRVDLTSDSGADFEVVRQ